MAWRCSGNTNAELIANLKKAGIIKSDRVISAMTKVDRANYVLDKLDAYEDSPQTIGHGATISAPHMHSYAAEHLLDYLKPGARVLDVGSGSGYLAAVLYHLVNEDEASNPNSSTAPRGKVVGVEHVPELVAWSEKNLKKDGLGDALDRKDVQVIVGDGRLGFSEGGPYDAIHVGAAAPTIPQALIDQLASPGRMFIPVGSFMQNIEHVDKDERGNVTRTKVMGVRYVPLTDRDKQVDF